MLISYLFRSIQVSLVLLLRHYLKKSLKTYPLTKVVPAALHIYCDTFINLSFLEMRKCFGMGNHKCQRHIDYSDSFSTIQILEMIHMVFMKDV